ncbi:hypothetical protein Moror_4839 [Moniliophthora roreri MCA 2997]|uniref:Uncharacterized protein n=1 Tax=Moniliophthora roreri (strain MCA 2997) TaxID=1381753 RepID=V2XVU9_MONRO|nr:hypothetical protein Moror_4839 [Moniliophthora roreri MCA 2997]
MRSLRLRKVETQSNTDCEFSGSLKLTKPNGLKSLCKAYHLLTSLNKEDSLAKLIEFSENREMWNLNKRSHKGPQGPRNGTKKAKPTQSQQHRAKLVEKVSGKSGTQEQMKALALQVLRYADHLCEECPEYYQPTKLTPLSQDDDMEVSNDEGCVLQFIRSLLASLNLRAAIKKELGEVLCNQVTKVTGLEIADCSADFERSVDTLISLSSGISSSLALTASPPQPLSLPPSSTLTLVLAGPTMTPTLLTPSIAQAVTEHRPHGTAIAFANQRIKSVIIHDKITLYFKQGDVPCPPPINFSKDFTQIQHVWNDSLGTFEGKLCPVMIQRYGIAYKYWPAVFSHKK